MSPSNIVREKTPKAATIATATPPNHALTSWKVLAAVPARIPKKTDDGTTRSQNSRFGGPTVILSPERFFLMPMPTHSITSDFLIQSPASLTARSTGLASHYLLPCGRHRV